MSAFWKQRPVLLTGATGLLGSWMAKRLTAAGADLVCLVRDWVPQSELVRSGDIGGVKVVRGDVRDQEMLERTIAEFEIDTVFHLAAQTIVGTANASPAGTLDVNIRGTWALLEACRRVGRVKQIVVASSDKAYGSHDVLPYNEDAPLQGLHPYDVSKSCADLICAAWAHSYKLPVCVTRCGNLYGGGDLNWNRIIPGTVRSVVNGERPVIRSDGQFIRDYFYVEDGAAAYMLLAEKMAADASLHGLAFNFSNELQITVLDLVNRILEAMGSELKPDVRNIASNEIRHQYLSAERARQRLQWAPLFTLEQGLKLTVDWYLEFLNARLASAATA